MFGFILRLIPGAAKVSSAQWILIGIAVSFIVGGYGGHKVTSWYWQGKENKAIKKALKDYDKKIAENRKIEIRYIEKQGKERIVYRDIEKKVIKYVKNNPNHECLNPIGLRLYREALAGEAIPDPSGSVR